MLGKKISAYFGYIRFSLLISLSQRLCTSVVTRQQIHISSTLLMKTGKGYTYSIVNLYLYNLMLIILLKIDGLFSRFTKGFFLFFLLLFFVV
jgi:hypothetical protein